METLRIVLTTLSLSLGVLCFSCLCVWISNG